MKPGSLEWPKCGLHPSRRHAGPAARSPADTPSPPERRPAVHYRDALMITLMAYRPLRLKNFASIILGVHLVQQGGGARP